VVGFLWRVIISFPVFQVVPVVQARGDVVSTPLRVLVGELLELGVGHFAPVKVEGGDGHGMARDFAREKVSPLDPEDLLEPFDVRSLGAHPEGRPTYQGRGLITPLGAGQGGG
jgi:hypothetical protein